MTTRSAGHVLTALVAVFSTGDLDGVDAIVHPDYFDHQGLGDDPIHGPSGFAKVVTVARSGYGDLDVTVEELVEEGDRATARLRWRGTRPSGELVERETLETIRAEDGLAVEHWGRPA